MHAIISASVQNEKHHYTSNFWNILDPQNGIFSKTRNWLKNYNIKTLEITKLDHL